MVNALGFVFSEIQDKLVQRKNCVTSSDNHKIVYHVDFLRLIHNVVGRADPRSAAPPVDTNSVKKHVSNPLYQKQEVAISNEII